MASAYFVDSSALVKRYVRETGTAWVRSITRRRSSTDIFIALITAVEVTSAIARRRRVTLSAAQAASLPDPALDIDDDDPDDQPIAIEGEPLSETILRERR